MVAVSGGEESLLRIEERGGGEVLALCFLGGVG